MKYNHLKHLFLAGILAIAMLAAGCGGSVSDESENTTEQDADPAETDSDAADSPDADLAQETEDEEETEAPTDVTVTMEDFYGDTRCAVYLLGLQEYGVLEGGSFTDTPEEGFVYLVLFLEIENRSGTDDYFNTEMLDAALDGEEITNTFLINDPEDYTTIFTTILAGATKRGFIVWQAPEDWSSLELTYHGWEGNGSITLHAALTPDDLCAPPAADE